MDQDGSVRDNGEVVELTDRIELSSWPAGSRVIVRRERPHPGAQLSFTNHDGYRFQAILTDQADPTIAILERRHRQRARVEDRVRDDKDTGLAKLPFKQFALNEVWLEIVMLAHDRIVWTQALCLDGELATAEPKRLRYRVLHLAAGSHSPAAAASCTSRQPGRGPKRSRPRSRSSTRSPPRPAEHNTGDNHPPSRPPRPPAAITAARTTPTTRPHTPPGTPKDPSPTSSAHSPQRHPPPRSAQSHHPTPYRTIGARD